MEREPPRASPVQRLRWGRAAAVSIAAGALTATGIVGAVADPNSGTGGHPPPTPSRGVGRDPLTPAELDIARKAGRAGLSGVDVNGAPGPEYLSFELADAKSAETGAAAPRRAAVYFYDYATDALIKRVVNLSTGAVEGTFSGKGIQPPPGAPERAKAVQLFLADGLSGDFRSRFARLTGAAFRSSGQVEIAATSYIAQPADPGARSGPGECGRHRCVQLITRVPHGPFIDITDIVVDLSERRVLRLKEEPNAYKEMGRGLPGRTGRGGGHRHAGGRGEP